MKGTERVRKPSSAEGIRAVLEINVQKRNKASRKQRSFR